MSVAPGTYYDDLPTWEFIVEDPCILSDLIRNPSGFVVARLQMLQPLWPRRRNVIHFLEIQHLAEVACQQVVDGSTWFQRISDFRGEQLRLIDIGV